MSSIPHRNNLPDMPVERCAAFAGGRPFVHEDGTVVQFNDNRWVLSTKPTVSIGFQRIHGWLLPHAKLVIAQDWLQANASMSVLTHYPTSYRAFSKLLPSGSNLSSVEQLTISHVEALEGAVERAYRDGRKAATLAPVVHAVNKAIRAAALKGAAVRMEFRIPKTVAGALAEKNRGIGRANPEKVLSEEVHVALIRAADLDLRAYDEARREINRGFAHVSWDTLADTDAWVALSRFLGIGGVEETAPLHLAQEAGRSSSSALYATIKRQLLQLLGEEKGQHVLRVRDRIHAHCSQYARRKYAELQEQIVSAGFYEVEVPASVLDLFERLYGLNGHEPHSIGEISRARGVSATSASELIQQHLSVFSPALRSLHKARCHRFRALTIAGIRRAHEARQQLTKLVEGVDWTPLQMNERQEKLEAYYGLHGRPFQSQDDIGVKPRDLRRWLSQVLDPETVRSVWTIRNELPLLYSRAVKACALKLQLCVARRIGAVLELPSDVKTKVEFLLGKPRFFVEFTRHKDIGLRGLAEWVQCPGGGYEEWAASAIADAQRITAPFRQLADEGVRAKLFIIPGRSGLAPLEGRTFWRYLRTNDESGGAAAESLLRRVEPRELLGRDLTAEEEDAITSLLEDFTPHWVRHTHWTTIESRIGIPRVAARYAGHDVAVGLTFYLSGGHELERARAAEAVEQGLGSGPAFDAIRYLYLLEHGFNPDATGLDLNPDAALRRIQTVELSDLVLPHRLTAKEIVDHYERTGIILSITPYGACLLGADLADCPAHGQDCSIGIDVEENELNPGCGCRYRVLLPHAVTRLQLDVQDLHDQIAEAKLRNLLLMVAKLELRLRGKLVELEEARLMKSLHKITSPEVN